MWLSSRILSSYGALNDYFLSFWIRYVFLTMEDLSSSHIDIMLTELPSKSST